MTYPNEQLWEGRPLRTSPAYDSMTDDGAFWGEMYGLEVPIYFAAKDFEETPTLRRSNAFDIVGEECRQVRNGIGILDITGFSRYEVSGPKAEMWLGQSDVGETALQWADQAGPDAWTRWSAQGRSHDSQLG